MATNTDRPPARSRLEEVMFARGLKQADLERRTGWQRARISNYCRGKRRQKTGFNPDELQKLALALRADPGVLLQNIGDPIPPGPTNLRRATDVDTWLAAPRSHDVPLDITYLYQSDTCIGFSMDETQNGATAPRFPGLVGQSVRALYMQGPNMSPWRSVGELVFYHLHQPPMPGRHAVIILTKRENGRIIGAVRKLVRQTPSLIELEQYNPPERVTLRTEDVERLCRVFEWSEAVGL